MTNAISQKKLWIRSTLAAASVLTAASGMVVACANSTATIAPTTDSGTDSSTSDSSTTDTGTKDTGPASDTGTDAKTTLYERLGKHAGIRAAVDAIVAQELMNTDIASYFFFQGGAPANGHPTEAQVEECFTDLVANAVGGPESYPATVDTVDGSVVTVADGGAGDGGTFYVCRGNMTTIHAPLFISGGTFAEFITIAAAELKTLKVATADIATLGAALEATKGAIVSTAFADAGLEPYPFDGPVSLDGGDGG